MEFSNVFVIIVTYNAMKWTERCFSSLRKSSVTVKTIVVDNGSTDGTQDFIKTNFPEVDFIQSTENLGFGKANNLGIEKAYKEGADFFYLMNQDAWIFEDSFDKMIEIYKVYPNKDEIGIISPMHLDGSEKRLDIFLDKYIAINFEKTRLISDLYLQNLKPYYEINFINAAHWLLTRHTIQTVGGFNPFFFHYGEDNEYVNRVHFHNKKVILTTKSRVVHDGKQQLNKVDYSKYRDLTVETKILNPLLPDIENSELRSLRISILKNSLTGNFAQAKNLNTKYKNLKSALPELRDLKKIITLQPHSFLNL